MYKRRPAELFRSRGGEATDAEVKFQDLNLKIKTDLIPAQQTAPASDLHLELYPVCQAPQKTEKHLNPNFDFCL